MSRAPSAVPAVPKPPESRLAQHLESLRAIQAGTTGGLAPVPRPTPPTPAQMPGVTQHSGGTAIEPFRPTTAAPASGGNWRASLSPAESWIIQHESGFRTDAYNKTPVYDHGKLLGNAWGLGQIVDNRPISQRPQGADEQLAVFRNYVQHRYGTAENAQKFWQAHGWYALLPLVAAGLKIVGHLFGHGGGIA